ncbi:hypothetical protein KY361_06915 [Candidatus Woesearchaeota archaeon]|nr:hypothetical protein [Candidatus Woesearchaeota archaeon]
MKKFVLFIALFVLIGCTLLGEYKFEDGLREIEAIDVEHETSMYKERLDKVMLNTWDVEEMLDDLDAIEKRLERMSKTDDVKALLLLVEFRKTMLKAEHDMIKVRQIGSKGNIMDSFTCRDKPYILNASLLMKDAVYKGADALTTLDKLTGFAVASEHINRDKIEFDESNVEKLLSQGNEGINIGREGGFCDKEEEKRAEQ